MDGKIKYENKQQTRTPSSITLITLLQLYHFKPKTNLIFSQKICGPVVLYRQRRRAVVFHDDDQLILLLALPVRWRRSSHYLSGHAVHAEGQVLVSSSDVVEQHGVGTDVFVSGHHANNWCAASDVLQNSFTIISCQWENKRTSFQGG